MGRGKGESKKGKDRWTRDGKDIAKLESRIAKVEDGRANETALTLPSLGRDSCAPAAVLPLYEGESLRAWKRRQEPIADQALAVGDGPRGQARFEGVLNPTAVHERERG